MEELIEKAKQKNEEAFTELILTIQKDLYVIAKIRLNEDDACDAIQDTMLIAYKNLYQLKENKYFKTWIIKILINRCNSVYRSKDKNMLSLEDNEIENITQEENNEGISFNQVISFLKPKEKNIMTLYYYLGYTTRDISKMLNISEGTIRSKISRAKQKIKKQYKGDFE